MFGRVPLEPAQTMLGYSRHKTQTADIPAECCDYLLVHGCLIRMLDNVNVEARLEQRNASDE